VQPDAVAVATVQPVPFVGVADGEGAGPVKVGKLVLCRDDRVHAQGRLLVSLAAFLDAVLAEADVEVGDVARNAVVVGEDENPRASGVDDDHVRLPRAELHDRQGKVVAGRSVQVALQARPRLLPQGRQVGAVGGGLLAEGDGASRLGHQQVALDQVAEPEVRGLGQRDVDLADGVAQAAFAQPDDGAHQGGLHLVGKCRLRALHRGVVGQAGGGQGSREKDRGGRAFQESAGGSALHSSVHPPTRSCLMSHRSPVLTSLSVFVSLALNVSER
jgi:hypothetical protein